MRTDNTKDNEIAALVRRIEKLERQAPSGFTSITRGQFRIGGTAVLLVDSSGGVIIHGQLNGDGTITWTGTLTNNGQTNLNGPTAINGTLDVSGVTNLLANLIVGAGGKITVGSLVLDPTIGVGAGGISAPTAIALDTPLVATSGDLSVAFQIVATDMALSGNAEVDGALLNSGITSKSGVTPNVWVDPATGRFYRVI